MTDILIYEQPLNERIRTFLRIEHLFSQANHYSSNPDAWNMRLVIAALLEVNDLLERSEVRKDVVSGQLPKGIRMELVNELERHAETLRALSNNPQVDSERLQKILDNIHEYLSILSNLGWDPGASLNSDELLNSIKQRISIPGGTCNFDLPNYHYWLNRPLETQEQNLQIWQKDLLIIRDSVNLTLNMIRNSANPSTEVAVNGFFEHPIDSDTPGQLVRVKLPGDSRHFPQISYSKHQFSIRFMEQPQTTHPATKTAEDVVFELHFCAL